MKKTMLFFAGIITLFSANAQSVNWKASKAAEESEINKIADKTYISTSWLGKTPYLYYKDKTSKKSLFYLVDARTGKKEPMFNNLDRVVENYRKLTNDTAAKIDDMHFYGITMKKGDSRHLYWQNKGKRIIIDRLNNNVSLDKSVEKKENISRHNQKPTSVSADSAYTMLGDRFNLYVRDNRTGKITRITTDGVENNSYCYRSSKDTITERQPEGRWYGHSFMTFVYDDTKVQNLNIINALAKPYPKLIQKKMPLPNGDGIRGFRLHWYNADTQQGKELPINKWSGQFTEQAWVDGAKDYYFMRRTRDLDTLELCKVNPVNGEITTIITEVCKPHQNQSLFNYRIIEKGEKIIWWSERTGRGNYYLYNGNGKLLARMTQGKNLVAGRIEHIDTLGKNIVFLGYGQENMDPYYVNYYRATFAGKQTLLTHGNGTHELSFSPTREYAVDNYSRMDLPTVYQTVDMRHPEKAHEFARRSIEVMKEAGWHAPTLIKIKAADEKTDLYGVMYTPKNLDPNKKYPVISNVYPGPQDDQIPRAFTIDDNSNQSLAELGFIVINVGPRGSSPLRGRDFYCYGYGNLRDYPLADDKHTIETLAKKYPFIDLDRVGIYGHSGGGFMTVTAMCTYPDFYKVGFAASGNYDNNIYIQWWGETFQGLTEVGKIPTTMELAKNLKGKLMLVSGDVDDNVPFSCTLRMAKALQDNNKRFDMMVLPGKDHGVWCPYYDNLVRYYFLENLVNPTARDIDIVNHK